MKLKRMAALLLAAAMFLCQEGISQLTVQAKEIQMLVPGQSETDYKKAEEAFEKLVSDHEVYALLYQCDSADILNKAGDKGRKIVNVKSGHQVQLTGVTFVNGITWYQVKTLVKGRTYTGYLKDTFLISADEGFRQWKNSYVTENGLQPYGATEGSGATDLSAFPTSYRPYIEALIKKHPNWTFVPLETGLDWSTVIENEMYPARNLVPQDYMDTWKESNEVLSAPYWVQASESIVRYYVDPRNFLNEESVFQFELLSYNSANHTEEGVKTILKNTFMSDTVLDGTELTYAQAFMKIGKELNISPYHLASRVRQEQGTKGDSPLISGTYPGYEGLYNYYNIQASGLTYEEIIINGLEEAKAAGWTSRYLALYGGSEKVGNNYIKIGQNTLYLQKFDVDDSDNKLYWHQYMQNLLAADNEGKSVKKGYEEMGVLNSSFVFSIPVYKNMPSNACPMPKDTLSKATLKASVKDYAKVTLSWSEIAGAQGYEIYRANSEKGKYKKIKTIKSVGTTTYSFSQKADTTYYYKVRGYKTLGGVTTNSAYSSVKKASTVIPTTTITTLKKKSYTKVYLAWDKVKNVTGYEIYRKSGKGGKYELIRTISGASTVEYTDATALPNKTYYYQVRGYKKVSGKNRYATFSKEKKVSTKMSTPVLTSVSVAGNKMLALEWKKEGSVTGYCIYRASTAGGSYKKIKEIKGSKVTEYTDESLQANGTYYYKIRSFVSVNGSKKYSPYSNVIKAKTKLYVPTVKTVSASSATKIKLTWKKVENATGYQIYRATSYGGKYSKIKTIKSNSTVKFTNSNLAPGKTYYYKIRAYSNAGDKTQYSKFSTIVSIGLKLEEPEIRSISKVTTSKATINWKPVKEAEGYRLYRAEEEKGKYKLVKTIEGPDNCSYTNSGLKKGKTYYYKLRSYVKMNGSYKYSAWSDIWSVQTKK